jgi:hypothetical protein
MERGVISLQTSVYKEMCFYFAVAPTLDLFADNLHHQCDLYSTNALFESLPMEVFANPPWHEIALLCDIIERSKGVTFLCVVPYWTTASWWQRFQRLVTCQKVTNKSVFVDNRGNPVPRLSWPVVFALVKV